MDAYSIVTLVVSLILAIPIVWLSDRLFQSIIRGFKRPVERSDNASSRRHVH